MQNFAETNRLSSEPEALDFGLYYLVTTPQVRGVGFEPTNPCGITDSLDSLLARYLNYLLTKKTIKPATIERKIKTIKSMAKNYSVDL